MLLGWCTQLSYSRWILKYMRNWTPLLSTFTTFTEKGNINPTQKYDNMKYKQCKSVMMSKTVTAKSSAVSMSGSTHNKSVWKTDHNAYLSPFLWIEDTPWDYTEQTLYSCQSGPNVNLCGISNHIQSISFTSVVSQVQFNQFYNWHIWSNSISFPSALSQT